MPPGPRPRRRKLEFLVLGLAVLGVGVLLFVLTPPPAADGEPVSVLLFTPDSLRADRLAPFVQDADAGLPAVPNVERLARRGTVFSNAWATAPWTAPSVVSVMTGHYPPAHGVVYRDDTTPPGLPTLPRILEERGYEIGNFSFFSEISYFRNLGLGPAEDGLRHRDVAGTFARWLGGLPAERPFFAWVHLLETHLPYGATGYRAPEAKVKGSPGLELAQVQGTVPVGSTEFEPGDEEHLLSLYDRDVEAMDEAVGRVLDALEAEGRLERTVIVFVADHGEELLDRGAGESWVGHASTAVEAHLHPEIVRVPLIVAGPGVPEGDRRHELVQPPDALPTLARLVGFGTPSRVPSPPLPGIAPRWTDLFRRGFLGAREHAYFDSSPGGNLTPQEKRGERLQGVTDGECLVTSRVAPGREDVTSQRLDAWPEDPAPCDQKRVEELTESLEAWRREQTGLRLELLRSGPQAPESETVDAWPVAIEILEPDARVLRWGSGEDGAGTGGQIALAWDGSGESYWIEYRLGEGSAAVGGLADQFVVGSFYVEQQRVVFGPVPRGFWNDLALYSPFEIRLVDAENQERSQWVEFAVEETE